MYDHEKRLESDMKDNGTICWEKMSHSSEHLQKYALKF